MFEGVPNYPSTSRFWEVIDKHKVNTFYTAPTAIRALMQAGDAPVKKTSRASLRLLGTVGEPINPEAWEWYHRVVGDGRCPIVDTWWQTETGGILITPLPGAIRLKPGSATAAVLWRGAADRRCPRARSWKGRKRQAVHRRRLAGHDAHRLRRSPAVRGHLFQHLSENHFTGDGCRRDQDGYYWITGRVDDVINVAGHRLGTAVQVGNRRLVAHPKAFGSGSWSAIRITSRGRAFTPMSR